MFHRVRFLFLISLISNTVIVNGQTDIQDTVRDKPDFVCPKPSGIFKKDCTSFYMCFKNNFEVYLCEEGMLFNEEKSQCDLSENVLNCNTEETTRTTNNWTTEHKSDLHTVEQVQTSNPKEKSKTPNNSPTNGAATKLGTWIVSKLSENPLKTAEYISNSKIQSPETTKATESSPKSLGKKITVDPNYVCPKPMGLFRNPKDCGSFYNCWEGRVYLQFCVQGLAFNEVKGWCDYPDMVPECSVKKAKKQSTKYPEVSKRGTTRSSLSTGVSKISIGPGTTQNIGNSVTAKNHEVITDPYFKCPEPMGAFRNANDCNSFYFCWDGKFNVVPCPDGLVFDEVQKLCDLAENVPGCGGERSLMTTADTNFICPQPMGNFRDPRDCNSFYVCWDGEFSHVPCQEGLVFDEVQQACNLPENVPGCGKDKILDPNFKCPQPFGLFRNSKDCGSFYNCWEGRVYLQYCGQKLVFNEVLKKCDYPDNVPDCQEGGIKFTTEEPEKQTNVPTTKVIQQTNTTSEEAEKTNAATTKVEQPTQATITKDSQQTIAATTMKELWITSTGKDKLVTLDPNYKCPQPFGWFRNPKDCGSFYNCWEERAQLQHCGQQLVFNEVISKCDYPYNVPDCDEESIKETINSFNTQEAITDNTDLTTGFKLRTHTEENKQPTIQYLTSTQTEINKLSTIKCITSRATEEIRTKEPQQTNAATSEQPQQTNTPTLIGMSTMSEIYDSSNTSKDTDKLVTLDPNYKCPQPFGLFRNPKDCGSYYNCWEERAQLQHCGQQLVFNEVISKCDYPHNVPDCDEESIKETINSLNTQEAITEEIRTKEPQQTNAATSEQPQQTNTPIHIGISTMSEIYDSSDTSKGPDKLVTLDPNYKCPQPFGLFRNPKDCGSYYNCWEERAQLQHCGQQLVFNEVKSTCDYPHNVPDCDEDTMGKSSVNSSEFSNFNPVSKGHCPPGYIFNQVFQKCYKKVNQSLTWWKAEQFCQNDSLSHQLNVGHLITLKYKEELNFLIHNFKDDINTFWTSGNDYMDRKLWRWGFNLLPTPFSYQSIIDPTATPNCIYLDPTMMIWNATDCLINRHYFICEINMK